MKYLFLTFFIVLYSSLILSAQDFRDSLPVRGFCIEAPQKNDVEEFIHFINSELAPRGVNTLILRVDFNYEYQSHPELRDPSVLSAEDAQKIVDACRKNNIEIIPQVNLLGHQSWANKIGNLLREYPELDETPHVAIPDEYEWPNEDGLYCKSYCPLHPEVHGIVFSLIDEICEAFDAKAFHAGMDEVFYIGDDRCPRCSGRDKAALFAGEVTRISHHLSRNDRKLWIWGDRLLDGKTTGMGMWEASMNNTHRAIDMIPRDVVICDWHYERPDQSAVYFAMKGFDVLTCFWRNPDIAAEQVEDMMEFRRKATPEMKERFQGVVQTVWSGARPFINAFQEEEKSDARTASNTFRVVFDE